MDLSGELTLGWFLAVVGIIATVLAVGVGILNRRSTAGWEREAEWREAFQASARNDRPILESVREFDVFMVTLFTHHQNLFPPIAGPALARAWDKTRGGLIDLLDAVEEHWNEPEVRSKLAEAGLTGEVGAIKAAILNDRVERSGATLRNATDLKLGKSRKRKTAVGAAKAGNVVIKSLIAAANATVVLAPFALKAHAATEVKDLAEVVLEHGGD